MQLLYKQHFSENDKINAPLKLFLTCIAVTLYSKTIALSTNNFVPNIYLITR